MRRDVSYDISIFTEFDGLFAIRDNRNGNLVVMTDLEFEHLLNMGRDVFDEYQLEKGLR